MALNSIAIHVEMLERETTHADTNWHERYLQEQKDHRDNVNHLNTVVDTRTETMVGWQYAADEAKQSAKSWEDRFNNLMHDMDGTMATLRAREEENARLNAVLAAIQSACKG